jgi:hypothetical protein
MTQTEAFDQPARDEQRHVVDVVAGVDGNASLPPDSPSPTSESEKDKSRIDQPPSGSAEETYSEQSACGEPVSSNTIYAPDAQGPFVQGDVKGNVIGTDRGKHAGRDIIERFMEVHVSAEGFQSVLQAQKVDELRVLLDLTEDFAPSKMDLSWLEETVIAQQREVLRTDRLLFIVCPDRTIARASAWAIVKEMGYAEAKHRRLLDFHRIASESSTLDLYRLRKRAENKDPNSQDEEIVVVVDAVEANSKAQEFLDSFVVDPLDTISYQLQQNRTSVLYLVDSPEIQARSKTVIEEQSYDGDFPFPNWKIPFLRHVLKPHFATTYLELEARILEQQERWQLGDKPLFGKIKEAIKKRELPAFIESSATDNALPAAETLFSGNELIADTVVYVATFFTDLNSREFQRLVALLLGEKTRTITVPTLKQKEDGTSEKVEVQQEKALVAIWEESMDQVKRQCSLVTAATEGTRTVDFNDPRLRARLKQYLEDENGFFVSSQFTRLFAAGVIFDQSSRIGENMVALTAAVTASDPDYYIGELIRIIEEFEAALSSDGAEDRPAFAFSEMFSGLDAKQSNYHFYQRISALIRVLLGDHQLKGSVHALLEELMQRTLFDAVLKIVRRLRFTAGFDEVYWLKQLFARGNDEAGKQTSAYLDAYLKSLGTRGYQLLTALDSWLPRQEPINQSPSVVGRIALTLLFIHCVEATATYDPKHYGEWPSRHPLFSFRDAEAATDNLNLLARWLFHPWMKCIFSDPNEADSTNQLIATLTFRWVLTLIGPDGRLASSPQPMLTANAVQRILIEQIVTAANPEQQSDMLTYWQGLSCEMIDQIKKLPYADESRKELVWQRNLLNDLIDEFRDFVFAKEQAERKSSH